MERGAFRLTDLQAVTVTDLGKECHRLLEVGDCHRRLEAVDCHRRLEGLSPTLSRRTRVDCQRRLPPTKVLLTVNDV